MIAVVGAGAMGAALAMVHDRAGHPTALLGTRFDDAAIEACRSGDPHPALGVSLPRGIDCRPHHSWAAVLRNVDRVVIGVSSDGVADVVTEVAPQVRAHATWVIGTKGWDASTLRTPSEVVGDSSGPVVVLAGPALAPELVANAPTAMVCASKDLDAAADVAKSLIAAGVAAEVTDDVVGAEIAAAYKNVTAIAVGMCEGLSDRLSENVFVHRYANARAAVFAQGLKDMSALASTNGGRPETIFGLAGAGDLYVTCLGGRNGTFGRLLGSGQTPDQAMQTIGSTVEGVANTFAALAVGERAGVELKAARVVESVLAGNASPDEAIAAMLASGG
jgi:glycerol-3-phosphate dehydrogenase (NAD(P)+)